VATAWSDLVATSMRSTSCNAFQIVPSPGTVGIVLKSWFVLCLFCVSLWMCFGFFLACFRWCWFWDASRLPKKLSP
jgi:hypothetical protein